MNDQEREMWIMNDEGLYRWWISSGLSKRNFVIQNRTAIDNHILSVVGYMY